MIGALDILRMLWLSQLWALVDSHDPFFPGSNKNLGSRPGGGISSETSLHSFRPPPSIPCHYSSIGFETPVSIDGTEHGLRQAMVDQAVRFVENPDTKHYPAATKGWKGVLHLPTLSGAELWGPLDPESKFLGIDPHFVGPSRLRMQLTKKTWHDDTHQGCFEGFASSKRPGDESNLDDDDDYGDIPLQLEFDCPTYHLLGEDFDVPTICTVQVAAFAHEITIFDTLQDYNKYCDEVKTEGRVAFADHAFCWTGLFPPDKDVQQKRSMAMFTGHVVKSDVKINEQTGEYFYWALVETLGGCQFDVVVHRNLIEGQSPPRPGCIFQGVFWLSGRILNEL